MSLKIETEIKLDSDPSILEWQAGNLYVGSEDGSIKSFDHTLWAKKSWQAHAAQPFGLAVCGDYLYSSSNDGGIRVWSTVTGEKITELESTGADVGVLRVFDHNIYAGDEDGNIIIYEKNMIKATYNVLEEVKDLWFDAPFLFTVRDLYITATEIKPEESKTRFMTRHTLEGRSPVRIFKDRLLFMTRDGNTLCLHDASIDTTFKLLDEIKVSDMIVTCLSAGGDFVWTGGWDGFVRRWNIAGDKLEAAGEINLGGCINSLAVNSDGAYVAATGGRVVYVKAT